LNRNWPAVSLDQQRQAAIDSTASALLTLTSPNVAAGVDAKTIQSVAFEKVKSRGVSKLEVAIDRQLLRLTADFDVTLKPDDLPPGSDKRPLVEKWKPQIAGHIDLFLGAAATLTTGSERAIEVRLLPSLGEVKIDKVTIEGSVDGLCASFAASSDLLFGFMPGFGERIRSRGSTPVADRRSSVLSLLH
jgi:hypothetical protein